MHTEKNKQTKYPPSKRLQACSSSPGLSGGLFEQSVSSSSESL